MNNVDVRPKFFCSDDLREIRFISPWLLVILADVILWSHPRGLNVGITSILREKNDGISESATHQEGRAIDLSVIGWSKDNITQLAEHINEKYAQLLGTSKDMREPKVCIYHNNGNGWHFHFQVRRIVNVGTAIAVNK